VNFCGSHQSLVCPEGATARTRQKKTPVRSSETLKLVVSS
jgi:hypothetical protein